MKSYGQFCPVAQALEVVGDRWTLLIIRELLGGGRRFGELLYGMPRIPRSLLATRLEQLQRAGLLRRVAGPHGNEYEPTEAALALEQIVLALGDWSRRWAHRQIRDDELDPTLLLWDMQRRIDPDRAPAALVVVRFDFLDRARGILHYWLKIEHGRGELCTTNPGLEETLLVTTSVRALVEIWMGERDFAQAIQGGEVAVQGKPELVKALPSWFRLSTFVERERAAAAPQPSAQGARVEAPPASRF